MIKTYLSNKMLGDELGNLYVKCKTIVYKYKMEYGYWFTNDEDIDCLIMLASAWSAIIRDTWRKFVMNGIIEPFEFWNAFIEVATFGQDVLFKEEWKKFLKQNKKLDARIKKTSNPKFIRKMFTGMDWKWLHTELQKLE